MILWQSLQRYVYTPDTSVGSKRGRRTGVGSVAHEGTRTGAGAGGRKDQPPIANTPAKTNSVALIHGIDMATP